MVLSVPDMGTRFWVMQFIDAWNNVPHAPGSRTGAARAVISPSSGQPGRALCLRA